MSSLIVFISVLSTFSPHYHLRNSCFFANAVSSHSLCYKISFIKELGSTIVISSIEWQVEYQKQVQQLITFFNYVTIAISMELLV